MMVQADYSAIKKSNIINILEVAFITRSSEVALSKLQCKLYSVNNKM